MTGSGGNMGYSIPVSISDATAQNPTATVQAGTVFNFGSGLARGDVLSLENTTDQRPTATSSASTGGDAASATDIASTEPSKQNWLPIAIVAVVGVLGFVAIKKLL